MADSQSTSQTANMQNLMSQLAGTPPNTAILGSAIGGGTSPQPDPKKEIQPQ